MAKTVHHGGKVGAAGKTLASNSSSKSAKSKAGTTSLRKVTHLMKNRMLMSG